MNQTLGILLQFKLTEGFDLMTQLSVDQIANKWIEMTLTPESECSDELFDIGFSLNVKAHDEPEFAWNVILKIVDTLDETHLLNGEKIAQKIASNLAAGPLESLLAQHGEKFISRLKDRARSDKKVIFILENVWKNEMSDVVWSQIRKLIDMKH